MTSFSNQERRELKRRLNHLRALCFPAPELIQPKCSFKFQKDFGPDDVLRRGSCFYPVSPSEIKDIWEDKRTLKDSNLDYIFVQRKKWFFNTQEKVGQFFLADGSRKVEFEFPYWMDMSDIIKTPGVRTAVFNVLNQCMGDQFPEPKTAQACFHKKLCQAIYNSNPSRESLEVAVMEMVETLRQKTEELLNQNHSVTIASSVSFKRYKNSRVFPVNTPEAQQVREYLADDNKRIYAWGEYFGIIQNATRIARYEEIRDHVRHPDKVPERRLYPERIYSDFCLALGEVNNPVSRAKRLAIFGNNTEISRHLGSLSRIWDVLDYHVDPALKKKKNKESYYADLVQKGLLMPEEVPIIRGRRLECNAVAHVNGFVKNARLKVINDNELDDLAYTLYDRHAQMIRKWLSDHDRE